MKTNYLLVLATAFIACGQPSEQPGEQPEPNPSPEREHVDVPAPPPTQEETAPKPVHATEGLYSTAHGYYVGNFNAKEYQDNKAPMYINKITISIDSIGLDSVFGHSIVAGNERPFKGSYTSPEGDRRIVGLMHEPGDDKYDGVFELTIDMLKSGNKVSGSWEANDKNLAVTKRVFDLEPREFKYNPEQPLMDFEEDELEEVFEYWETVATMYDQENYNSDYPASEDEEYITPDVLVVNPSTTKLTKEDIENMYLGDLEILRNSIYARHGYSFKNRKMRHFFDTQVDWYMPISTDIRSEITEIELQNIALLKRYEQHAERYYDYFGR